MGRRATGGGGNVQRLPTTSTLHNQGAFQNPFILTDGAAFAVLAAITIASAETWTGIQYALRRTSELTGNIRAVLWAEDTGEPGAVVAQSAALPAGSILTDSGGTITDFPLGQASLSPGTYLIGLLADTDIGDSIEVHGGTGGSASRGFTAAGAEGPWTPTGASTVIPYYVVTGYT